MEPAEREKRIRSVRACSRSFIIGAPEGKYKIIKRLGRKLTFWYIRPFGDAQNEFNEAASGAMAALHESLTALEQKVAALEQKTDRSISDFTREQRQTLARAQTAQQDALNTMRTNLAHSEQSQAAALDALSEDVSRTLSLSAPESRPQAGVPPLTALELHPAAALHDALQAVEQAQDDSAKQTALDTLEQQYTAYLEDAIRTHGSDRRHRPMAIVCRKFASGDGMEAIRNEVWDLCRLLKRASRYPACIVSIEPEGGAASQQGDVHYVPEDLLGDWMKQHDPALLIFCESTTAILNAGKQCMILRSSLVRLSAQNPAQTLGGSHMQELLHLCDHEIQRYVTASSAAADTMEQLGFRRPRVLYPYLDTDKPLFCRKPRVYDAANFTVGFASSPMQPEQSDSRGIPALCETVRQNPDMRFIVLWRDADAVPVPEALTAAENCEVRTGKVDMAAFYSEIDCVLIPYADANYNHACSLSAAEGMLTGIPAAATPAAGVSELIAACGIGEVAADTSAEALGAALRTIRAQYPAYGAAWRLEKLRTLLNGNAFVQYAEECAANAMPWGVCTLYEWDRRLKTQNRHLVRGAAALKAYYQRQDVAKNYTETRFLSYPQSCFDRMERSAVAVLIEQLAPQENGSRRLLDLACGNGRILQMLLPLGTCTAGDASPAMLEELQRRYGDAENLTLRQLDLLSDPLPEGFDAITVFRFLRHYEYSVRRGLWAKLRDALSDNGILLFDVPNALFEIPHRQRGGWELYPIYDVFWTEKSIRQELADNGLELTALIPVGEGLYPDAEHRPMTWTAAAKRR